MIFYSNNSITIRLDNDTLDYKIIEKIQNMAESIFLLCNKMLQSFNLQFF